MSNKRGMKRKHSNEIINVGNTHNVHPLTKQYSNVLNDNISKKQLIDDINISNKRIKCNGCAIILMGLPGSGKSYLSSKIKDYINRKLENNYNFINLNPDDVIIYKKIEKSKELSLKCKIINKRLSEIFKSKDNRSFIYDGTGSNKSTYNFIFNKCQEKNYNIFLVYIKSDLSISLDRNSKRIRNVDPKFIEKYSKYIDDNFEYYSKREINYLIVDNNDLKLNNLNIIDSRF